MYRLTEFLPTGDADGISHTHIPGPTARAMWWDCKHKEEARALSSLAFAEMRGLLVRRIRPRDKLARPLPTVPWLVLIAAIKNSSAEFDKNTLSFLVLVADQITVTAVEPRGRFYAPFVNEALKGKRILLIQARAGDVDAWQDAIRDILSARTKAEADTHWPTAPP